MNKLEALRLLIMEDSVSFYDAIEILKTFNEDDDTIKSEPVTTKSIVRFIIQKYE